MSKNIDLRNKDRDADIYTRIEKAIPGSKVVEIQAKYSNWIYYETADEVIFYYEQFLDYKKILFNY